MIADLKGCFFHIWLLLEQCDLFRILWYADNALEKKIDVWHFTVHVWGVASSPFIATRYIHQVAKENRTHASQLTISSLMCNMYVDDLVKSLDTIDEVRTLYRESIQLSPTPVFS